MIQQQNINCPFIYAKFECDTNLIGDQPPVEIRIPCYGDNCPVKLYEPLKCLNPAAPEGQRRYIGGHCRYLINICEQCPTVHKCKKQGESKDACRQDRIDEMFRNTPQKPQSGTMTTNISSSDDTVQN